MVFEQGDQKMTMVGLEPAGVGSGDHRVASESVAMSPYSPEA
jgi:hypothetical protein